MTNEEGLELLRRILGDKPPEAANASLGTGTGLPLPGQPDHPSQSMTSHADIASTKCLSLGFLHSRGSKTSSTSADLKTSAEQLSAQVADGATSAVGNIAALMARSSISIEGSKVTISLPIEVLNQLLQALPQILQVLPQVLSKMRS